MVTLRTLFISLLLLVGVGQAVIADEITLYVAVNGNDTWSGKLLKPNSEKSDGPLASLAGARDAVRRLRTAGKVAGPVTVNVRGGIYRLCILLHPRLCQGSHGTVQLCLHAVPGRQVPDRPFHPDRG